MPTTLCARSVLSAADLALLSPTSFGTPGMIRSPPPRGSVVDSRWAEAQGRGSPASQWALHFIFGPEGPSRAPRLPRNTNLPRPDWNGTARATALETPPHNLGIRRRPLRGDVICAVANPGLPPWATEGGPLRGGNEMRRRLRKGKIEMWGEKEEPALTMLVIPPMRVSQQNPQQQNPQGVFGSDGLKPAGCLRISRIHLSSGIRTGQRGVSWVPALHPMAPL
jgi:hypothetical protein